jgi:hypothetical protein
VERAFLDRLVKMTLPANAIMNTRFVQEEFEKMVGHPVAYTVIYRMLKRHDWRPVRDIHMATPPRWEAPQFLPGGARVFADLCRGREEPHFERTASIKIA